MTSDSGKDDIISQLAGLYFVIVVFFALATLSLWVKSWVDAERSRKKAFHFSPSMNSQKETQFELDELLSPKKKKVKNPKKTLDNIIASIGHSMSPLHFEMNSVGQGHGNIIKKRVKKPILTDDESINRNNESIAPVFTPPLQEPIKDDIETPETPLDQQEDTSILLESMNDKAENNENCPAPQEYHQPHPNKIDARDDSAVDVNDIPTPTQDDAHSPETLEPVELNTIKRPVNRYRQYDKSKYPRHYENKKRLVPRPTGKHQFKGTGKLFYDDEYNKELLRIDQAVVENFRQKRENRPVFPRRHAAQGYSDRPTSAYKPPMTAYKPTTSAYKPTTAAQKPPVTATPLGPAQHHFMAPLFPLPHWAASLKVQEAAPTTVPRTHRNRGFHLLDTTQ